jgi:hypothetical protein
MNSSERAERLLERCLRLVVVAALVVVGITLGNSLRARGVDETTSLNHVLASPRVFSAPCSGERTA